MISNAANLANKRAVKSALDAIVGGGAARLAANLAKAYHPEAAWRGSHPWNEIPGLDGLARDFWAPLQHAFPDLERRDDILIGGDYEGREYVGAVGHLVGSFKRDWLGLPATGKTVYLRYGEFHQMSAGRIMQSTVLLDVLDFIRQAGFWPLPPSLGLEARWAGPFSGDGVLMQEQDQKESESSLKLTLDMQTSLGENNDLQNLGRDWLLTMPQKQYWHPRMMWYGPGGIGTTRGLDGFVDGHQLPFRTAFPRNPNIPQPAGMGKHGGSHYVRIGDGRYSATGGWPSRHMLHQGAGWLGLPATGRPIAMRVMDFYLADEGLIRENWVPIDILNVLLQLDLDLLARVRTQAAVAGANA